MALVHLDQVFGLATGALDHVVDMRGGAFVEIGDDEADVEAADGCLDAGADATLRLPGFRLVSGLVITAQHRLTLERAAGADIVGGFINETLENLVAGQSEEVVERIVLAPGHDLRPAIVAVAADQDAGGRPCGRGCAGQAGADAR